MQLLEYNLGPDVRAFSTPRHATGAGEGAYDSFNVTHYCGDSPQHVAECREALCRELGIGAPCLLLPRQTHTARVACIDDAFLRLAGDERAQQLEGVDALVTQVPRICIGVSTADCVPLLLFDPHTRSVAAVHAGWRGMVAHIVRNAVAEMTARFGVDATHLYAVVGPCIGPESFEVGGEVYEAFQQAGFNMPRIALRRSKWHIDLWAAAVEELEACGIDLRRVQVSGIDTFAESDRFFSARKLGIQSGRIYSGIMLR